MAGDHFEEPVHLLYSASEINPCRSVLLAAVHSVRASGRHSRAIHAAADLLAKLRLDFAFLGNVARAAWLGGLVREGSIDVLALMQSQQKNQVAMMASNRGFRVEREEIEQSEELDLVPLNFVDKEGDVRINVLVATNALYGRMVAKASESSIDELPIRVPNAEDFALLLGMSGDDEALRMIAATTTFDRAAFNEKVTAIGLGGLVIR
jgi:hypothetical protein